MVQKPISSQGQYTSLTSSACVLTLVADHRNTYYSLGFFTYRLYYCIYTKKTVQSHLIIVSQQIWLLHTQPWCIDQTEHYHIIPVHSVVGLLTRFLHILP